MKHKSNLLFFKDTIQDFIATDENSTLTLSNKHIKFMPTSLKWSIKGKTQIDFNIPIGYERFKGSGIDLSRESFVIYLYNEVAQDTQIRCVFKTDGIENCYFTLNMNFSGWRSAWVMFDRDMMGEPNEQMNQLTVEASDTLTGKDIYIGLMILSTPLDGRHHTKTPQVPFVNHSADRGANSHWMSLYTYDRALSKNQALKYPKDSVEDLDKIKQRYEAHLKNLKSQVTFEKIIDTYRSYKICKSEESIVGRSIDFDPALIIFKDYDKHPDLDTMDSISLKDYTKTMYDLAIYYRDTIGEDEKNLAKQMFLDMYKHLYDQGIAAGSSVGTVHHLGYSLRDYYYPSLYMMRQVFQEENLLEQVQQDMAWFCGLGRIFYEALEANGVNMDVLNTELEGMLVSILLLDNLKCEALMYQFKKWLTFACSHKPGISGPFKKDGTGYHHTHLYPAYAKEGLEGVTFMIYLLSGTVFRLPKEQHQIIKYAVLQFRLYSNLKEYLLSISGRHPTGTQSLSIVPFKYMALAGSPDGKNEIDEEVASAYMRLVNQKVDSLAQQLLAKGIKEEQAPIGNWSINYGALALHRRSEWLVGVKGFSRYLWANESYAQANLYGRYISHGHIQILAKGNPINNKESGYVQEGWDFNSWPGTTTIHLPVDELKSHIIQVDPIGGVEEMLLSDETYCGSVNIEGKNGVFAMKLHEHPKYNGTHRARKSVFMFDNRIICLGTNIENENTKYPTRTTLFQNHLGGEEESIILLGIKAIKGLNYEETMALNETTYIIDNKQNGYVVKGDCKITLTSQTQQSRAQNTGLPTQGNFAKAVIEHGYSPSEGHYEYMIVVDTCKEEMQFIKQMIDKDKDGIYTVIQKDKYAHILKDHQTNTIGYALYEANECINKAYIKAIDTPALVLTKEEKDELILSVCDPDLRYYEGVDRTQYDDQGIQKEVSPYGLEWKANEGKVHKLNLEIIGQWELKAYCKACEVIEIKEQSTLLGITCHEACKVEVRLKRVSNKVPGKA